MTGSLLHHVLELAVVQVGVEAAGVQQLVVGALLYDVAVPHHQDEVGMVAIASGVEKKAAKEAEVKGLER